MTLHNDELEEYAKKPLAERIQDGISMDKNSNINMACMMEPMVLHGFSHLPNEDEIKKAVEGWVKKLRNTICRDLIQDEIKKAALGVTEMVERITGRDPIQHEAEGAVQNIVIMLKRVANRRLTQDEGETLDRTARQLVDLAIHDATEDEVREAADGVARVLVRLASQDMSEDEVREAADGVARVLVRLASQDMSEDEVREAADRIRGGLKRLANNRFGSGIFLMIVSPCIDRLADLANPNVAKMLDVRVANDAANRLDEMISRYMTYDEIDAIYPMWIHVQERNLTRDIIKERAEKVVREFLSLASRRPNEDDVRAYIDMAAQELVIQARSRHLSKDYAEGLTGEVTKKLAACATDRRLSKDDVEGLTGEVVGELMRAITKQNGRLEKMRLRWRGDMMSQLDVDSPYFESRSRSWQTYRLINAHTVGKANFRKQMVELFKPIMIDLLDGQPSTLRDLNRITNSRQARRTFDAHSPILQARGQARDRRVKQYDTVYNGSWGGYMPMMEHRLRARTDFDMVVLADAAYVKRQRQFWEDSLKVLSEWLRSKQESGENIALQNRWLIHHIVNNDIGLHVLFDNLSLKCELRHLPATTKRKIMYNYKKDIQESELQSMVERAREEYKNDTRPNKAGYVYPAKSGNGVAVHMDVDGDGKPYVVGVDIIPKPHPFNEKDAKEAVGELVGFAADFSNTVAKFDGLGAYKIPQNKMEKRIGELVIESALALKSKPDGSPREHEDEWAWICKSWSRTPLYKKTGRMRTN